MTNLFDVNNITLTGPQTMYKMKALLISAGWVIKSSGDGLSAFNASGDVITSGSSGANGLANTNAWFRIQSPAGASSREYLVQRNASNTSWSIRYSYSAGFSGGSPSATVLPTATDSQTMVNATIFNTDNNYRTNFMASNTAPYGFYMASFSPSGNTAFSLPSFGAWMMDPLIAGSYSSLDVDPIINYVSTTTSYSSGSTTDTTGYLKKGLAGEGYVNIKWLRYLIPSNVLFPKGVGNDVYTAQNALMPIMYSRYSGLTAPVGWKGISSLGKWIGNVLPTGALLSISSSRDYWVIGDMALPWNGSDILL